MAVMAVPAYGAASEPATEAQDTRSLPRSGGQFSFVHHVPRLTAHQRPTAQLLDGRDNLLNRLVLQSPRHAVAHRSRQQEIYIALASPRWKGSDRAAAEEAAIARVGPTGEMPLEHWYRRGVTPAYSQRVSTALPGLRDSVLFRAAAAHDWPLLRRRAFDNQTGEKAVNSDKDTGRHLPRAVFLRLRPGCWTRNAAVLERLLSSTTKESTIRLRFPASSLGVSKSSSRAAQRVPSVDRRLREPSCCGNVEAPVKSKRLINRSLPPCLLAQPRSAPRVARELLLSSSRPCLAMLMRRASSW